MPKIRINNFACHYEYQHREGAPCVIFLNGILSPLESWHEQAVLTSEQGYSVLRYEYRGQWHSQVTPCPYSMQLHVDDLRALMQILKIDDAHLVGTSYGGQVAMKFASVTPESVRSLMLIATSARISPAAQEIISDWRRAADKNDAESLFRTITPSVYSERYRIENESQIENRLKSLNASMPQLPDFCTGHTRLVDALFPELSDGSLLEAIRGLPCPTSVVAAEKDRLYPPSDSKAIATCLTDAETIIIGEAGHGVVAERPRSINKLLRGHLGSCSQ